MSLWIWHLQRQLDLSHLFHYKMPICDAFTLAVSLPSSPYSLTDCTIKCYLFLVFFVFLIVFFFPSDMVRKEARSLREKKKYKQPRKREKAKQILPPRQRSQSSFISTFNLHWDFPICWCWKVHWILAEVQVLKYLLFFFKQNLYPQLHGKQIKEQADEACPIQGGEFASTVINFRGELFSLSFSHIVVLKTFKANFLVVRTEGGRRHCWAIYFIAAFSFLLLSASGIFLDDAQLA